MNPLVLQRSGAKAPYEQLRDHLHKEVLRGAFGPTGRLPSVRRLADVHGISPVTVQKALRELQLQGIIVSRQGKGLYGLSAPLAKDIPKPAKHPEIWVEMGRELQEDWSAILNHFSARFPHVAVCDHSAGNDVQCVALDLLSRHADSLEDITEFVEEQYGRSSTGPVACFRTNGRLHALPVVLNTYVVVINEDLFERLGVPVPDSNWTWEQCLETARALTRPADGTHGLIRGTLWDLFIQLVWQAGGAVFSDDGDHCLLGEPPAIETAQFLRALGPTTMHRAEGRTALDTFLDGRVGMMWMGVWGYVEMMARAPFRWSVRVPPMHRTRCTLMYGNAYGVHRRTPHRVLAMEFLKELAGFELWPSRTAHPTPLPFHASLDRSGPVVQTYRDALAMARSPLSDIAPERRHRRHLMALPLMNRHVKAMMGGSEPPEEAVKRAEEDLNAVLSEREMSRV